MEIAKSKNSSALINKLLKGGDRAPPLEKAHKVNKNFDTSLNKFIL